ncbi:unnamed protein product [Rangifer tarandus platyrhynchus]|uniref:Uncharacterized protein n=1 Tax=Rangifer tarandus platyrhynchus TaxID=3082113 RepID=A0AC59YJ06_RANTA
MASDISAGWLFKHPLNKQAQRLYWEMILDLYLSGIRAELALLLTHWNLSTDRPAYILQPQMTWKSLPEMKTSFLCERL